MKYQQILFIFLTSAQSLFQCNRQDEKLMLYTKRIIAKIQAEAIEYENHKLYKKGAYFEFFERNQKERFKKMVESIKPISLCENILRTAMLAIPQLIFVVGGYYTVSCMLEGYMQDDWILYIIGSAFRMLSIPFLAVFSIEYYFLPILRKAIKEYNYQKIYKILMESK
ncbi:hypothetical protein P3W45_000371 [Vairimorpha bombi]|jgi:hypothetical protein